MVPVELPKHIGVAPPVTAPASDARTVTDAVVEKAVEQLPL